ncbi:hypothetical protein [Parafrankia sp. EUN1f]|uniref:hypothetical protein n=1 Tax=Parafrankia sp. EUN1f TaxID=102897 RepID=UPI0001C44AE2|nr:hypothetical protein [Parafrankia sp. EUN1f]EFC83411.1 hypothetical protein FrEUN1fDRAFT_3501 [Parafrankia sp. EUN1f]
MTTGHAERAEHLPLPLPDAGAIVVGPPGDGPGYWAGAPSAILVDGVYYLTYRLRRPVGRGRGYAVVVASSTDGEHFTQLATITRGPFGAESLERAALAVTPQGTWRLYVSCATPDSYHWWVDVLEADSPAGFDANRRQTVLPGDARTAVKDPVIRYDGDRWHLWASCHPLEDDTATDRMDSRYATSPDGLTWTWHGVALAPRPGHWDARGVRISSVLLDGDRAVAFYDGRASAAENWAERTGVAFGTGPGHFEAVGVEPAAQSFDADHALRYLSVVELPGGGYRTYYEIARPDGAHELRSQLHPA